jgi:hypothetical protein
MEGARTDFGLWVSASEADEATRAGPALLNKMRFV